MEKYNTQFDEYKDFYEMHRYHVDMINTLRTKIKGLEDKIHNLEDRPLEKAISIGFYRTVAALRKKEFNVKSMYHDTTYSDYLLENKEEILK